MDDMRRGVGRRELWVWQLGTVQAEGNKQHIAVQRHRGVVSEESACGCEGSR